MCIQSINILMICIVTVMFSVAVCVLVIASLDGHLPSAKVATSEIQKDQRQFIIQDCILSLLEERKGRKGNRPP